MVVSYVVPKGMKEFRYKIGVEWSDAKGCYVAVAPAFDGVVGGGDTVVEAVEELLEGCELALGVLDEDEVPAEDVCMDYSGNIRLRIPKSLHKRMADHAEANGVSLNQVMVSILSSVGVR